MLRPVLLVRIGLGTLVLAARWGENASAPSSATVREPESTPALEPSETPGAFLRRHLEHELRGQFGLSWDELHPAHQLVVTRERYERRRSELFARSGVSAVLATFEVLDVADGAIDVPGASGAVSKAVTVRYTIGDNGHSRSSVDTLHAVESSGRWTWILPETAYRAYAAGSYPGSTD